jgi:hypothetical protein
MVFDLVTIGFIGLIVGFFLSFCTGLYAHARVNGLLRSISDLDWHSLADLQLDVQKLKKHVQKNQANINASQKLTQKEKMAMAIEEAQVLQASRNVMPMQNVER